MSLFLILAGAVVSVAALLFWFYLNGMASAWSLSNTKPSMDWFSGESLYLFWLPFAVGIALAFAGWKLR